MDWYSGYQFTTETVPRCTIPVSSNTFKSCSKLGGNPVEAVLTPTQATDLDLTRRTTLCCVLCSLRRSRLHVRRNYYSLGEFFLFLSRPEPYTSIPVKQSSGQWGQMGKQLGNDGLSGGKKQLFIFHYIFIRRLIFLSMLIDFEGGGG